MGNLNVRHDEVMTSKVYVPCQTPSPSPSPSPSAQVFALGRSPDCALTIASGYLNLTPQFEDEIRALKGAVCICTASPSTHGFHNAKGIAGIN